MLAWTQTLDAAVIVLRIETTIRLLIVCYRPKPFVVKLNVVYRLRVHVGFANFK